MTRDDVVEKIIEVISDQFGCDTDEIRIDDKFASDLYCDEDELLDIVAGVDAEFGIVLPDGVEQYLTTVNSLIDAVCEAVGVTP